jgi:hypothetical protein
MRKLDADTESIREERQALLDDMRGMMARLDELTSEAVARWFRSREPAEPAEEEMPALVAETETEPLAVGATDEPPATMQTVGPDEGPMRSLSPRNPGRVKEKRRATRGVPAPLGIHVAGKPTISPGTLLVGYLRFDRLYNVST